MIVDAASTARLPQLEWLWHNTGFGPNSSVSDCIFSDITHTSAAQSLLETLIAPMRIRRMHQLDVQIRIHFTYG